MSNRENMFGRHINWDAALDVPDDDLIDDEYEEDEEEEEEEQDVSGPEYITDHHVAPFPFLRDDGGEYQFVAKWNDVVAALEKLRKEQGKEAPEFTDVRSATHVFEELDVLRDEDEIVFVSLDDVNGESVWRVYWNSPYRQ